MWISGSSREWSGFNTTLDLRVIHSMVKRAEQFVPSLSQVLSHLGSLEDSGISIRTGLRPYCRPFSFSVNSIIPFKKN